MISVAAFNAAGDGPRSLPTRGRTQQAGELQWIQMWLRGDCSDVQIKDLLPAPVEHLTVWAFSILSPPPLPVLYSLLNHNVDGSQVIL